MAKKRVAAEPCLVRFGTPNDLGHWQQTVSEGAARKKIVEWLRTHETFARTHIGTGGSGSVQAVIEQVPALVFHKTPTRATVPVDQMTGFVVAFEYRKGYLKKEDR